MFGLYTPACRAGTRCFRTISIALLLIFFIPHYGMTRDEPWPTHGWPVTSPQARGLDEKVFIKLDRQIRAGKFGHVDRMVVVRHGLLVVDKYYQRDYDTITKDYDRTDHPYNYQHPNHHPYYQGRPLHTLQSVTKSVAATLIGIAIERGEIPGLDTKLLTYFQDYDLSKIDPRLQQATLEDLLTMRSGIEWHEHDRPLDETNSVEQLEAAKDWIQFTLDQGSDAAPGEKWVYSSGGSQLIAGIIKQATGMHAAEYAELYLFKPLGIYDYHWKKTPGGHSDTEGGLYLESLALAKIGYLYLWDGVWNDKRLLPEGWVAKATSRIVDQTGVRDWGYGFQWWRLDLDGTPVWAALGYGGQTMLVLPQSGVVGVINSWNIFEENNDRLIFPFRQALIDAVHP